MNFTGLKQASSYEVGQWLKDAIPELTQYQKERIREDEIVRFSGFYFYKDRQEERVSFLWRWTILFLPIAYLLLIVGLPIRFLMTGKWGYSGKLFEKFLSPWEAKIGVD